MGKFFGVVIVLTVAAISSNTCCGQNWRDPAFQQPLPQYYSQGRNQAAAQPTAPRSTAPRSAPQKIYVLPEPSVRENLLPPLVKPNRQIKVNAPPLTQPTPKLPATAEPRQINQNQQINKAPTRAAQPTAAGGKKDFDTNLKRLKNAADNATKKKAAKLEKAKQEAKAKKTAQSHPVIDYAIYRDRSQFPIDPRKPCSTCLRSVTNCQCGINHGQCGPGNHGRPHQDREAGGYSCGKNCPDKRPMFSVYWPRPFSAKHTPGHPDRCNCDQCATRVNDWFDHLIDFKLIDYQRKDNGYCGPGADPYGCLGESKYH